MPGGIIDRDHDLGVLPGRIGASDILEVRRKRHLQTLLFALAGLRFAARRLLEQAGRQLAGHDIQRGKTIHLILIIPCPHQGTVPFDSQGGAQCGHQRKTRFVLA